MTDDKKRSSVLQGFQRRGTAHLAAGVVLGVGEPFGEDSLPAGVVEALAALAAAAPRPAARSGFALGLAAVHLGGAARRADRSDPGGFAQQGGNQVLAGE